LDENHELFRVEDTLNKTHLSCGNNSFFQQQLHLLKMVKAAIFLCLVYAFAVFCDARQTFKQVAEPGTTLSPFFHSSVIVYLSSLV
jgi:hypothetical protein